MSKPDKKILVTFLLCMISSIVSPIIVLKYSYAEQFQASKFAKIDTKADKADLEKTNKKLDLKASKSYVDDQNNLQDKNNKALIQLVLDGQKEIKTDMKFYFKTK